MVPFITARAVLISCASQNLSLSTRELALPSSRVPSFDARRSLRRLLLTLLISPRVQRLQYVYPDRDDRA